MMPKKTTKKTEKKETYDLSTIPSVSAADGPQGRWKKDMSTVVHKHLDVAVKQVDADRRRIKFIASQEVTDRDGDIILVDGIDVSDYRMNPTFLANHDRNFILGKVLDLGTERRMAGKTLVGMAEILPVGSSERVDEAWNLIKFGARNGISIGFLPLETAPLPLTNGQAGILFKRTRLLEISSVSLPACPTCVVEEKRWRAGQCSRAAHNDLYDVAEADRVILETMQEAVRDAVGRAVRTALYYHTGRMDLAPEEVFVPQEGRIKPKL